MIARQGNNGRRPFAGCKPFNHPFRIRTSIDVVAQENRHGVLEGLLYQISRNALSHLAEQIVTTVNITDAINYSPVRYSTCGRDPPRSAKRFGKRSCPAREA